MVTEPPPNPSYLQLPRIELNPHDPSSIQLLSPVVGDLQSRACPSSTPPQPPHHCRPDSSPMVRHRLVLGATASPHHAWPFWPILRPIPATGRRRFATSAKAPTVNSTVTTSLSRAPFITSGKTPLNPLRLQLPHDLPQWAVCGGAAGRAPVWGCSMQQCFF